jgi:HEAT repeat protein
VNDSYHGMERCLDLATPLAAVIVALDNPDWQVRLAAIVALGDRRDPSSLGSLVALLAHENKEPLYSQQADLGGIPAGSPHGHTPRFPEGTPEATQTAWARRGRLKQAACLALGQIGVADRSALELLHRYAIDQAEDYAVRAAANKALGQLRHPSSRPVLEGAIADPEWCTRTEAVKALEHLTA